MRPKRLLLFALIAGVITTVVFYIFITSDTPEEAEETDMQMIEVVAAAEAIEEGTRISGDMVEVVEIAEEQMHPNAVREPGDVTGTYAKSDLAEEEVILDNHFQSADDSDAPLAQQVEEGRRGVSVNVDYEESVSYLLEPDDYVDVLSTRPNEDGEMQTEVLIEQVRVLAIGERFQETSAAAPDEEGESSEEETTEYQAVTLELTQEGSAQIINANQDDGDLHLSIYSQAVEGNGPGESADNAVEVIAPSVEANSGEAAEPNENDADNSSQETEEQPLPEENEPGSSEEEGNETNEETAPEDEAPAQSEEEPSSGNIQDSLQLSPYTYRANIRESPSLEAPVLEVVDSSTRLEYTDQFEQDKENRTWVFVEYGEDSSGWISNRITQFEESGE
ncbi:Flp pilus assembly protein CpaB [Marinococcus luteus]|uniref:Flp pilus assembly protein CpaB n=1 Tax=Marinococcus luteus TaxID=1122204 RepID=A0A1H2XSS0_9BACI|nr:Flp pilus assembly protein CpaB [Marinococcus luteus]SDW95369.1 Flp pilus assembly protein CpaB [Marinococcus luteus]